jgi:hypothetical protein
MEQKLPADQRVQSMPVVLQVWVRDLLAEDLVKEVEVGETEEDM